MGCLENQLHMDKQSISMYTSPYLILQSKARPRGCPRQQEPHTQNNSQSAAMLSHGWRVPRIKIAKNSSLGVPLLRQIPNKGLLSHATAFLLLALVFGISLFSLLIFKLLFLLLAFDISHLTHLLCYLFSNVPACLLFLLSPSS